MSQSLQVLINLSEADQKLQILQRNVKNIEKTFKEARKEVEKIETVLKKKEKAQLDVQSESQGLKKQIETYHQAIQRMEGQVEKIRNEKEFIASKKQLEEARKKRGILEDTLLNQEIKIEEVQKELTDLQSQLSEAETEYKKNTVTLKKQQDSFTKEINALRKKQKELLPQLEPDLLNYYQRCTERGFPMPISPIVNKTCGGCHLLLLPQFVNEMIIRADHYGNCPHCSRVLFYLPVAVEPGDVKSA